MKALKDFHRREGEFKRKATYILNLYQRRFVSRVFREMRDTAHEEAKARVNRETAEFKRELQRQKLTALSSKVDQMMQYMGQLEDKIKREQDARSQLMETYSASLNKGVDVLSLETSQLMENPLVKEISLVVAKDILTKSKEDPTLMHQMFTDIPEADRLRILHQL